MKRLPHRMQQVLKLGRNRQIDKILDIGSGNGYYSVLLKEAFNAKEVYGVDISQNAVNIANNRGVASKCINLNDITLPFGDSTFGLVFAGEIIEHMLSTDKFLSEINRVLKPDGMVIITTPNIASWHGRLSLMLGYQPYSMTVSIKYRGAGCIFANRRNKYRVCDNPYNPTGGEGLGHIQFFTHRGLYNLVECHGFKVVKVQGVMTDEYTFPLPKPIKILVKIIEKLCTYTKSLSSDIIIQAVKVSK